MKHLFKGLVVVLLLTACSPQTPKAYNHRLQSWLGKRQQLLIMKWGQPDGQFALDADTYVLTYIKTSDKAKDGQTHPYSSVLNYQALAGPRYGYSQYPEQWWCKTFFTVRHGVIVNYSFSGDDCV